MYPSEFDKSIPNHKRGYTTALIKRSSGPKSNSYKKTGHPSRTDDGKHNKTFGSTMI